MESNKQIAIYRYEIIDISRQTFCAKLEIILGLNSDGSSVRIQSFLHSINASVKSLQPFSITNQESLFLISPRLLSDEEYFLIITHDPNMNFPLETKPVKCGHSTDQVWHRDLSKDTHISPENIIKEIRYDEQDPDSKNFWHQVWVFLMNQKND